MEENKLQQLRDEPLLDISIKAFKSAHPSTAYTSFKRGWNAALALDLHVKFAEWYHSMILEESTKLIQLIDATEKGWKRFYNARKKLDKISIKKHYQYWINNIFKPE